MLTTLFYDFSRQFSYYSDWPESYEALLPGVAEFLKRAQNFGIV